MKTLRIVLVVLVLACWAVGISAVLGVGPPTSAVFRVAMVGVFTLNILCGLWLYRVSGQNSIEWTLFGLVGNVNALKIKLK